MAEELKALFRISGPDVQQDEILVTRQGLRVGRSRENNLMLDHREMSRQHVRVIWREDGYYVEDLNSSNGSWLNEERLAPREPVLLHEGDAIRVGPFLLKLVHFVTEESLPAIRPPAGLPPGGIEHLTSLDGPSGDMPPYMPYGKSKWLEYLPAIYSEDEFMGRYLLIFESLMAPLIWTVDHFDLYLSPQLAPPDWLEWMSSWFDVLLLPELPIERQRALVEQLGYLFLRRGTRLGLERLLELYFGVRPQILEPRNQACHFIVRLPLSQSNSPLGREVAARLIDSQKPAFASYSLEIL